MPTHLCTQVKHTCLSHTCDYTFTCSALDTPTLNLKKKKAVITLQAGVDPGLAL